ncbi:MAG: peptidylprolyl isomerase [Candidatus Omnitrophica bacterium]|nr:peptidylprolyl isomerase [Candidatus Omnitrophota bacterium]
MLKVFRHKNVTKIVLWALLILILPAFVLWGVGSFGRAGKKGPAYAGTIDGKKVSFEDFAKSLVSIRCQIVLNYFNNQKTLEGLLQNKPFLGRLAWDRLIILKRAHMAKIKMSDKDVINFIRNHPLFLNKDGKFENRAYEYFLRNSLGIYPRNFEELVRENLMIQKLTDDLAKDVKITDDEVVRAYEKSNSKFQISYVFVPYASFNDQVKATDEEVKDIYQKNIDKFTTRTKGAEGKEPVTKTASFDEVKAKIKTLLVDARSRPLAFESAKKTYEKLQDLITKEKLSFESAAAKLGLKIQGSKPVGRGDYIEGVGEADLVAAVAADLKKDEISKPVETRRGILIFRVVSKEPFDQGIFQKQKADFTKQALANKKTAYTENWLREQEKKTRLNIDLNDYDKYYR